MSPRPPVPPEVHGPAVVEADPFLPELRLLNGRAHGIEDGDGRPPAGAGTEDALPGDGVPGAPEGSEGISDLACTPGLAEQRRHGTVGGHLAAGNPPDQGVNLLPAGPELAHGRESIATTGQVPPAPSLDRA